MGQFWGIGIVSKMKYSKENLLKAQATADEFQEKWCRDYHFDPELFDIHENDSHWIYSLKQTILNQELIPFLEMFYPRMYDKNSYYDEALNSLKTIPSDQWLDYAKRKEEEVFQFDEYGECDYIDFERGFRNKIPINYESILISMEGKVMMEVYGRQFDFFKSCMIDSFSNFKIAKALRVYITG